MSSTANQKTNKKSSASNQNQYSSSSSSKMGQGTVMDQLFQLMSQINASVKASEYNNQLANQIFSLCQHLKSNGQQLEQTHKSDLNKVFVSLRQACCRDNGQLGTPCRLKIMELIELRAMNWKSNMTHSQYYLGKAEKTNGQSDSSHQPFIPSVSTKSQSNNIMSSSVHQKISTYNPPKQQQSVYHSSAVPQQFGQGSFAQPPPPLYLPAEIAANPQPMATGAPGYFLIPAAGAWAPQMIPTSMLPSPQFGPPLRQPPPNQMQHPPDWMSRNAAIAAVSAHFGKMPPNMMSQSAYIPGSAANSKSSKQPQFREEITIRNADSGKIMGVKGRRVAAVEEISKTVISFQKVDNNSRYRTLAIVGNNQDSIQHAKRLIEETIKRNVSPNRLDLNGSVIPSQPPNNILPPGKVIGESAPSQKGIPSNSEENEEDEDDDQGISIETNADGTLKLSCTDPEMLQAAQQALTEYLNLRTNRMTAEERELRKERRKSMPLQSSASKVDTPRIEQQKRIEVKNEVAEPKPLAESRKTLTGSTPNLLVDSIEQTASKTEANDVLRYERDKMLTVRDQVKNQLDAWTAVTTNSQEQTADSTNNEQLPFAALIQTKENNSVKEPNKEEEGN